MGRHAAPELDSPTEVIRTTSTGPRPAVDWLDKASDAAAHLSTRGKVIAIGSVALAGVGLSLLSGAHSGSSSTSADPTASAHQAGIAYASSLRESGYNTMSITLNCGAYQSGYTGAQEEAFTSGCADVTLGMMQDGKY